MTNKEVIEIVGREVVIVDKLYPATNVRRIVHAEIIDDKIYIDIE